MLIRRFDRYWAAPGELPAATTALHDNRPGLVFNIFVSNDDDPLRNHAYVRDPRAGIGNHPARVGRGAAMENHV